ncbi:MAG TPA: DUF72 domain-containing protein [Solirubrobacteraceae bacterium]|nr:DUF72 domain-containing protein [Solirubrobacteraceae bacterium]
MGGRLVIGTSSWADPGFVEEWYPPDLPAHERLGWYAQRFEAVEVNTTFYAVPSPATVARWVEATPQGFTFDVKLHRLLSRHAAGPDSLPRDLRGQAPTTGRGRVRLDDRLEAALADRMAEAVEPLRSAGRLATFLLQLTPAFKPGAHALDELAPLIGRLSATAPVAVELRHRGWTQEDHREDTLGWLEDHEAAFVCLDGPRGGAPTLPEPLDAVTRDDVAYFRAHGRNLEGYLRGRSVAERFGWHYSDEELEEIRGRLEGLAREVPNVRMMFNNNRGSDAPVAAQRMRELTDQAVASG